LEQFERQGADARAHIEQHAVDGAALHAITKQAGRGARAIAAIPRQVLSRSLFVEMPIGHVSER
jgi:hypothetical protein